MNPRGAPQGAAQQGAVSAPVSAVLAPAKLALTLSNNSGVPSVRPRDTNTAQLHPAGRWSEPAQPTHTNHGVKLAVFQYIVEECWF